MSCSCDRCGAGAAPGGDALAAAKQCTAGLLAQCRSRASLTILACRPEKNEAVSKLIQALEVWYEKNA